MINPFGGAAGGWQGRGRKAVLVAVLGTMVLASMPATALAAPKPQLSKPDAQQLAAAPYPVTSVSVRYYPMYNQVPWVAGVIAAAGCGVASKANLYIAAACGAGIYVLGGLNGQQSGWWVDEIFQTSQVFVHMGGPCNSSRSSCSIWNWDVFLKTSSASLNASTYSSLLYFGPACYGWSQVGYSPRAWWLGGLQLANILNGNGI
jgi:hypothetical protein